MSLPSSQLFFYENAKIWVGGTTVNREKKGEGLTTVNGFTISPEVSLFFSPSANFRLLGSLNSD